MVMIMHLMGMHYSNFCGQELPVWKSLLTPITWSALDITSLAICIKVQHISKMSSVGRARRETREVQQQGDKYWARES
jgi:predicted ferric reductase